MNRTAYWLYWLYWLALGSFTTAASSAQLIPSRSVVERSAPPPAPPAIFLPPATATPTGGDFRAAAAVYSIGDPTPEEQAYVELINRARANPQAEALLFANTTDPLVLDDYGDWNVDLELMLTQFAEFSPVQPLAINALLTQAARRHTADMFENVFQGHTGSDGSSLESRVRATGYQYNGLGENVFSYASSVFHGHAGFEVDWGPGVGGMQTPPGHRLSIHSDRFREIGVGVTLGRNEAPGKKPVGPQLVTQEFGVSRADTPFITGVAYYDLNGNSFYDPGEGIGGLSVAASGVATAAGVTARSGGYAIPVPRSGVYTVNFSGPGFAPSQRSVTVAGGENVKADFVPAYVPPTLAGPVSPVAGRVNGYSIGSVGGSTTYQWRVYQEAPAAAEGAENGVEQVEIVQTSGYSVVQSHTRRSGGFAFQLAHPRPTPRSQFLTLRPIYLAAAGGALAFQSRLGWAAVDQAAVVQVSADAGRTWEEVYRQAGTDGRGETAFVARQIDLARFAGTALQIRFVYEFLSGGFFDSTDAGVGWFIDDITLSNVNEVLVGSSGEAPGGDFQFRPEAPGRFVLQGRALAGHDYLPWGPGYPVQAVAGSNVPEIRVTALEALATQWVLRFELLGGQAGAFRLEGSGRLGRPWAGQPAELRTDSTTRFHFIIPRTAEARAQFYRVLSE